jgi:plasmid stabilization system protein ParE
MSLPFKYHPEVQDEIDAAYLWYETERIGLGERFLAALRDQMDLIGENPELYAVKSRGVRCATLERFPYVVYYRVEADHLFVVAVQHGRKNQRRWRSRA